MESLIEEYARKNVFFIHTLGGDEDVPNIHFKKHYRLDYPVISDNLDQLRHIIRVRGITNVAVFDGKGVCVFNKEQMGEDPVGLEQSIADALKEVKQSDLRERAHIVNGSVYAPAVSKQERIIHERMPKLAAGENGELHLVYVSDESGSNDVLLRSYANGRWGEDVKVAATEADEYAPTVVSTGPGKALVAYVGQAKGRYEIFSVAVDGDKVAKSRQVSRSKDDAMAPFLGIGRKGDVWLAWYEWAKMGALSRDREILLVKSKGSAWSKPVQVSPKNVPTYEDHADPVVCGDGKGGAWVAWAWDYHGTLREKPPVDENSVFLRHVDKGMKMGPILAPGWRGEGRARDYVPSLAVTPDGVPWVAWDNSHKSSLGYGAKAIFVNSLRGDDFEDQSEAAAIPGTLDTPQLLLDPEGQVHLLWGQQTREGWKLCARCLGPQETTKARKLKIEGKVPRYPTGCFDTGGCLWVAYTDTDSPHWKIHVEAIE